MLESTTNLKLIETEDDQTNRLLVGQWVMLNVDTILRTTNVISVVSQGFWEKWEHDHLFQGNRGYFSD